MGIRPAKSIRDADKAPWTRYSRCKPRKSFIKAMPHANLHQYRMGAMKPDFDLAINMVSENAIIIRDNAIESARQSSNKYLETEIAGDYYLVVRVFPHHVVRENKMISGAGADRLQKGMRRSFGRPTGRAARLKKGSALFTIYSYKKNENHIKKACDRAMRKLSGKFRLVAKDEKAS